MIEPEQQIQKAKRDQEPRLYSGMIYVSALRRYKRKEKQKRDFLHTKGWKMAISSGMILLLPVRSRPKKPRSDGLNKADWEYGPTYTHTKEIAGAEDCFNLANVIESEWMEGNMQNNAVCYIDVYRK